MLISVTIFCFTLLEDIYQNLVDGLVDSLHHGHQGTQITGQKFSSLFNQLQGNPTESKAYLLSLPLGMAE